MSFHVPNQFRVRRGTGASSEADGNNGWFWCFSPKQKGRRLMIVASDGMGWEHVSVHASEGPGRSMVPTWAEMCFIKDIFWDDEDVVVQFHPRKSEYVNFHAHTLHLWRSTTTGFPTPLPILIGPAPTAADPMAAAGSGAGIPVRTASILRPTPGARKPR